MNSEEVSLEEMNIPNELVGKVIGRGGAKIRQLQDDSGCRIVLAMSSNGETTRNVALQGTVEQRRLARELITQLTTEDLEFVVPQEKIGLLIGKKGETIRKLQQLTGAQIFIGRSQGRGKQVRIAGNKQTVEEASKKLLQILNQEFVCGICMEVVLEKEGENARFGILPACSHCFCMSCITKWRKTKFDEDIRKSCPECRVVQDFVIPSNIWVENPTSKAEFVERFKTKAAKKDCKIFLENFGHCPSGSKCVYNHQMYASTGLKVETVKLPGDCVGFVIGKGGVTIKTLQTQTNTKMMVMQQDADLEDKKDLQIVGAAADVEDAVLKVQMMILEFKMKKLRSSMNNFMFL